MRRSSWAWLALLVIASLTGLFIWLRTSEAPARTAGAEMRPVTEAVASTAKIEASLSAPELPAGIEALLPVEVRDLVALADAGEERAACRLGSLLAQCGLLAPEYYSDKFVEQLERQERSAAEKGDLEAANQTAGALLLARTRQQRCSGLPDEMLALASPYLRQAAMAGDREAMVRYLRGEAFSSIGMSESQTLRSPHFDQWRREALGMLKGQLAQGSPEAVLLLLEAHSDSGRVLSFLTQPDPLMDRAYLRLAERVFHDFALPEGWAAPAPDARLDREARELAARWHSEHFAGRRYSLREDTLGLGNALMPMDVQDWVDETGWVPACADPAGGGK
ncbi:MAG TPA: hypothetical protein VIM90_08070 [Arenimonas sp.]